MKKPLYIKIFNDYKNLIDNKTLLPGDAIDSEKEMMDKYNCSRDTVRKSTTMLEQKGYIKKSRGKASIVIENIQYQFPAASIESFKELAEKTQFDSKTILVNLDLINRDDYKFLKGMRSTKVYLLERIRQINGESIVYDIDYLDTEFVPYMDKKIAENSIYEYIENELKIVINYSQKNITVERASDKMAKIMDIEEDSQMVVVKSSTYTKDNEFFQYSISYHKADKFSFTTYALRKKNID